MSEFLTAVADHAFLRNALLTGVLAGVACGVVGSYVVVRRISYMAGGIAHCVLGGIGAAVYLQRAHGMEWADPLYGALAAALLAALIIGTVSLRARERVDTVIGALWAIGMATGVIFLWRTPGYAEDIMSYLFGNILMVTSRDLWLIAALDAVVVVTGLLFYHQFLSISFDEEFAETRGVPVELYFLLLLMLTAVTVVLLVTVVGIVLVIALLTIPAAVAGHFTSRLSHMMALSTVLSIAFTTSGLAVSYGPDLPAGATIILIAGGVYLLVALGRRFRPARGARRRAGRRATGGGESRR
ncbi:MAG: iron chelate uptake ABC transporter family permease subunit [Candidatus Eisenbacteria bacterium]|nr:iron chelate uptake ABC transporter family permease subunit [Candidatus Eisenbacteria bacterium]